MRNIIVLYLTSLIIGVAVYGQSTTVNVKLLGAKGDGISDDTKIFQKASEMISKSGGTIIIPKGIYRVGRQKSSQVFGSGYSFDREPILRFRDVEKPIKIVGIDATLKINDNLRYGSFNPVNGRPDSIRKQGNPSDYYASAFEIIDATNCKSISVEGLELDGNFENLILGPGFGSINIQLVATGIRLDGVKEARVSNCYIHHCGLDGITVSWPGLSEAQPLYPHVLENVRIEYCGRQALSLVGGNSLVVNGCSFSHTGKLKHGVGLFYSPPSAGIDLECEGSTIINVRFSNCIIADNSGPGLSTIGHPLKNISFEGCTFVGTTNSAIYPKSSGISFSDCKFIGKVERLFGSELKQDANKFLRCSFSYETSFSPTGEVFLEQHEFYESTNIVFDQCVFDLANQPFPRSNNNEATFKDCFFNLSNNSNESFSAIFEGKNEIKTQKISALDLRGLKNNGQLIINGKNKSTSQIIQLK